MEKTLAVANTFLLWSLTEANLVTPMKLQKLVFYAHGWYLGNTHKPLVDGIFEAWPWGPAIYSLYDTFKKYKGEPITKLGTEKNYRYIDGTFVITNTTLTLENPNLAGFIKDMWDLYKGYSQAELAAATHLPGTPWTMVRQGRAENDIRVEIPDELIYDYFHKKVIEINKEKAEKQKQDQQPNC